MDGGEDRHAVVRARDNGVIRDVAETSGDEALVAGGYPGDVMEMVLEGKGGNGWGRESEG